MVTSEYVGVCCLQAQKWLESMREVNDGANWNKMRTVVRVFMADLNPTASAPRRPENPSILTPPTA